MRSLALLLLLTLCTSITAQTLPVAPSAATRKAALDSVARDPRRLFQNVAARLATNTDTALAWRHLDTLLTSPTGDMFWTYPATAFWVYMRDRLDTRWRARFRDVLRSYTPYRGDTENHFLMHYTYLLIFSEEWPEMRESEWFNGRSSAENHAEAREYLLHWIDETARYGLTEWDSPRYLYFYIAPLLALADGSRDTAVSRRAGMLLELLLADYAVEYLNGAYCGAHSRDGDASVIDPRRAEATCAGRFYFEDRIAPALPDMPFWALSKWECPGVVRGMATDRADGDSYSYTVMERRRTRARMRGHVQRFGTVLKQTWMCRDLALGSMGPDGMAMESAGIAQPIQQHTWDVTFAADRPNATIFAIHPDASEEELATYFPEEPELMEAGILGSKASYGSGKKWIGGSRYETVLQNGPSLLARYDIPSTARWKHVDIFIPKSLDTLIRDTSGWILCRMGNGFVGLYPFDTSVTWIEEERNWRVRLGSSRTGVYVHCGNEGTLDGFLGRLRNVVGRNFQPTAENLEHRSWGVIQRPPDGLTTWIRFREYVEVQSRTGLARLKYHGSTRTLDFVNATVVQTDR